MTVWLNGSSRGRRIDRSGLRTRTKAILSALGCRDADLSVSLIGDAEIAALAGRYGRTAKPTDVLAFSMLEGPGADHRGRALGDVVISIETADRQARGRGVSLDEELRDLVIHGVLHVLGMDHERGPTDAREMRVLESHLRWLLAELDL
jgi:probable rRNA maturation factor